MKTREALIMLTRQETADRLRVTAITLDRYVRLGFIRSFKVGKHVRFLPRDVDRFFRSCERRARK
jgi:excisionase family DNA binding protein